MRRPEKSSPQEIGAVLLPRFLMDTHVVVRGMTDKRKLSRAQARVLDAAVPRGETLGLSAMSLLEIAMLSSEGKLRLKMSLDELFDQIQSNPIFRILPLTYEVALEVAAIGPSLRDPADRVIVATARVHRLRLITSDQRILESNLTPCLE